MQVCTVVGGEDRLDRFGEPLQPVDTGDQDVVDAALLEVGEDLHPELRALVGLEPHAEHFALAVHPDRHRQIAGPALHAAAVADLQHHAVQEHDRVDILQRPGLPRAGVLHDRVGDAADQIPSDFDAVDLGEVRFDIPRREPAAVEREDLLVEPLKPPLTLTNDLRLEAAVAVPGSVDLHRPVLSDQRLRRAPVAGVARAAGRLQVRLIPQVVGELDLHRALHQPLRQLRKQPARPDDLLLALGAGEQLVDHPIREKLLDPSGRSPTPGGLPGSRPLAFRCARPTGSLRETPAEPWSCVCTCVDVDMSLLWTHAYTEGRTHPVMSPEGAVMISPGIVVIVTRTF